ncbi:MAG: PGPGW domain-containing protein [Candidatus Binatia bacterium]
MLRTTRQLLWRACRITAGMVLLALGLFLSLPLVPGPGFVLIAFSLAILSRDFPWAEKLYNRLKQLGQKIFRRSEDTTAKEDNDGRERPSQHEAPR